MKSVLEAIDARFMVGDKCLLDGATLALDAGRVTAIIGPNGAGKSTLIRLLSGEIRPASGSVLSFGAPLATIPNWRLACRRAVMTQATRLSFPFRVHEVVRLGTEGIGRSRAGGDAEDVIRNALVRAEVMHLAAREYPTLSGGEQQRVQFARSLAQLEIGRHIEPRQALILDEPVASLDLRHQLLLLGSARKLARSAGTAVLVVVHDLNLAAGFADRIVALADGRIVADGAAAEVIRPELLRSVFQIETRRYPSDLPVRSIVLPQYCDPMPGSGA